MLKYKCRKCGRIIEPEGKGCLCGESWGSLKVISTEQIEYEKPKTQRRNHNE